jgi:hypothetical protein
MLLDSQLEQPAQIFKTTCSVAATGTQPKRRGRLPKPVVIQPTVPPLPVTYALHSHAPLPSTDASAPAAASPKRMQLFVPQFSRAHSPAYEGGGNDVPTTTTTIDALKGKQTKTMQKQKKQKKQSSEAWTEIQQKNYAFSGDHYILQSHDFIPFEDFEEEEPAEFQQSQTESEEEEIDQDSEEEDEVLE